MKLTWFAPSREAAGKVAASRSAPGSAPPPAGLRGFVHSFAREASSVVLLATSLYAALALASFAADPARPEVAGPNWVGPVGAAFSEVLVTAVGVVAWLVPFELVAVALPLLSDGVGERRGGLVWLRRIGEDLLLLTIGSALVHVALPLSTAFGQMPLGGAVGELAGELMRSLFSAVGSFIIGLTVFALILVGRASFSFIEGTRSFARLCAHVGSKSAGGLRAMVAAWAEARAIEAEREAKTRAPKIVEEDNDAIIAALSDRRGAAQATAVQLEKTLADYGVSGKVEEIHPGPTVTTFEVSPAAGTKVSKVASLADDLALGLSRKVRIIAPIPGKNRIGFEVPNDKRVPVNLRELVEDRRFQEMKAPLPCVLGRDIIGAPYFADLASMPHVIVAGATGAGKSVGPQRDAREPALPQDAGRAAPVDDRSEGRRARALRPHPAHAAAGGHRHEAGGQRAQVGGRRDGAPLPALRQRGHEEHHHLQRLGRARAARRGAAAEAAAPKVARSPPDGTEVEIDPAKDGSDAELPEKLPFIVIVVDEFADLMMQQGKDVEASVARLAQKARAAGMHVILATQRPSVDVITGMIKANFPTRIAFRVAQKVDSRTILDEQGAEHLLGRGDMLDQDERHERHARVQCPFCSEEEVQRSPTSCASRASPSTTRTSSSRATRTARRRRTTTRSPTRCTTRRCASSPTRALLDLVAPAQARGSATTARPRSSSAMEKRGLVGGPANGAIRCEGPRGASGREGARQGHESCSVRRVDVDRLARPPNAWRRPVDGGGRRGHRASDRAHRDRQSLAVRRRAARLTRRSGHEEAVRGLITTHCRSAQRVSYSETSGFLPPCDRC
jgi:S-DNA-T family DNA segregation ATPase FtsK/SpoIIIE